MFRGKVTEGEIFSIPFLNDLLVGVDPKAIEPGIPTKPKVAGCKGWEMFDPSSN